MAGAASSSACPPRPRPALVAVRAYFPATIDDGGAAEGALDDRHRARRLGPARLARRPRRTLDAAARSPRGARRDHPRRRLCRRRSAARCRSPCASPPPGRCRRRRRCSPRSSRSTPALMLWRAGDALRDGPRDLWLVRGAARGAADARRQSDRDDGRARARSPAICARARTGGLAWDTTSHAFPETLPAE